MRVQAMMMSAVSEFVAQQVGVVRQLVGRVAARQGSARRAGILHHAGDALLGRGARRPWWIQSPKGRAKLDSANQHHC